MFSLVLTVRFVLLPCLLSTEPVESISRLTLLRYVRLMASVVLLSVICVCDVVAPYQQG